MKQQNFIVGQVDYQDELIVIILFIEFFFEKKRY